jgi:alpha-D-xyloside xylohydrolase
VVDHPDDPETWSIDDQYLMGEAFLVAPLFAGEIERSVYLPDGDWFDFWTGRRYAGGQRHVIAASLDTIALFVRSGSAVPLAEPTDHVMLDPDIEVRTYGPDAPDSVTIYHDDGVTVTPIRLQRDDSWKAI